MARRPQNLDSGGDEKLKINYMWPYTVGKNLSTNITLLTQCANFGWYAEQQSAYLLLFWLKIGPHFPNEFGPLR